MGISRPSEQSHPLISLFMVNNRMEEMPQSSRRKRDREMDRSPRSSSPPSSALSLEIVGRHALLFDDDSTADFINSQDALLPWNGDPNLVIDRYDVRHLLQDLTVLRRKKRAPTTPDSDFSDVTREELDVERYRDLPSTDDDQERVKRQKSTGGEYQNVPFSYGTEESFRDGRKLEGAMESSEFNPPFPVPDNLHSHLVSAEAPFKLDGLLFGTLSIYMYMPGYLIVSAYRHSVLMIWLTICLLYSWLTLSKFQMEQGSNPWMQGYPFWGSCFLLMSHD